MPRPRRDSESARRLQTSESFALTDVGLEVVSQPSFEHWAEYGGALFRLSNMSMWALGDWLVFGEAVFSETWSQAVNTLQRSEGTLQNLMTTCALYGHSERRHELSFSHHVVVQRLPDRQQWLDRAIREQLSVRQLRALVQPDPVTETAGTDQTRSRVNQIVLRVEPRSPDVDAAVTSAALMELVAAVIDLQTWRCTLVVGDEHETVITERMLRQRMPPVAPTPESASATTS